MYGKENLDGIELFYEQFEQGHWQYQIYQCFALDYRFDPMNFSAVGFRYALGPVKPMHIGMNTSIFPIVSLRASYFNTQTGNGLNLKPEFGFFLHCGQERLINFKAQLTYGYDMGRRFYSYDFTDGMGSDHDLFGHNSLNIRLGIGLSLSKLNDLDFGKEMQASPRFSD